MKRIFLILFIFTLTLQAVELKVTYLPDQRKQVETELFFNKIGIEGDNKDSSFFVRINFPVSKIDGTYQIKSATILGITLEGYNFKTLITYFIPISNVLYIKSMRE